MRIIVNQAEYYVFKGKFYRKTDFYYRSPDNNLSHKFFSTTDFRLSKNTRKILNMLSESPLAPDLIQEPKEKTVSKEDQLQDLLNYLEKDYDIKMDDKNRFYRDFEVSTGILHSTRKQKTQYFSWKEIIQIYNTPHRYFKNTFPINGYIMSKYEKLNDLNKKYVYLNLTRIKGRGFEITSEKLITLPY